MDDDAATQHQAAVDAKQPVVVYPVKSLSNFSTDGEGGGVFGSALLVRPGATVRQVVGHVASGMVEHLQYAELLEEGGTRRRVGEEHVLTGQGNIIKFFFRPLEERGPQQKAKEQPPPQQRERKRDKDKEDGGGGGES